MIMQKWDYEIEDQMNRYNLEYTCRQYGEEGWELAAMSYDPASQYYTLIFKRPANA